MTCRLLVSHLFLNSQRLTLVDSLWTAFKNGCRINVLGSNVPPKIITELYSQPWIYRQIKQLTKRKERAYNRYRKIQSAKDYANDKHLKNVVHNTCANLYTEYVNDIIMDENHKPKRLWRFIKSKRTQSCGVAPLQRDGIAYSDARMKATILNNQFTSVFTTEDPLHNPYQIWVPAQILQFQTSL